MTHRAVSSSHAAGHAPDRATDRHAPLRRVVVARAPTRLDFGGGWTDVPPYADEAGGFVCNVAIARHATVRLGEQDGEPQGTDDALARAALRRAGLDGLAAAVRSDFPVGAGLGGSSAAGVALQTAIARWRGESIDADALARRSRAVEVEELRVAGGWQDHFAAAHGGALAIRFAAGGIDVRPIPLAASAVRALEHRCIVAYTGEARVSAHTITGVLDAYARGDATVIAALARMAALAELMADALRAGRIDDLGLLVGEHWAWQRALHAAIPTPAIDRMIDAARAAGAHGAKALGASGGGCVLAVAPEARADEVRRAMDALGRVLLFTLDLQGATVHETPATSPA